MFFLAKGTGTIEFWKLSKTEQQAFHDARYKEVKALLDLGAMKILSLEESLEFRKKYPDYVLPSRYVDRWKPQDDGGILAKSRIVVLGFKDPHVLQLERSAPTPTNEGFTLVMQTMASLGFEAVSADI